MNKNHPMWEEFIEEVDSIECDCTMEAVEYILEEMGLDPIDVEESVIDFEIKGAFCACEIAMNLGDD